ncbi:MAG TPA: hypothetical protein VK177_04425 [Flavobacteriales bacterium]|nr:hypothetical protein [Flavobacteriales bacterium]
MNFIEIPILERIDRYVEMLIVRPLKDYGHHSFSKQDKVALRNIIHGVFLNPNENTQQLASNFGHYTKNWNIDWHWIARHILHDNYNIEQAKSIIRHSGINSTVVKEIDDLTSQECYSLYLSEPSNPNSAPKEFLLRELIENGDNFGKSKENWKPIIGITDFGFYTFHPYDDPSFDKETEHYYDTSTLQFKPLDHVWNEKEKNYVLEEKPLTERQKKIRSLIKVTITRTDDHNKNEG